MKWLGHVDRDLSKIKAGGDIKARMKLPHVIELAASIKRLGGKPANDPVIDADGNLLAGRDRFAALMVNGTKRASFHVGEFTPNERRLLELDENLRRRVDDRDTMLTAAVALHELLLADEKAGQSPAKSEAEAPRGRGRPTTPKGEARKAVAAKAGVTVEAVRKAEQREAAKSSRSGGAVGGRGEVGASPSSGPPPLIETYGHAMPAHVGIGLSVVVEPFRKLDKHLRAAQAATSDWELSNLDPAVWQPLRDELHALAERVRAATPGWLCPYCYGDSHPTTGPICPPCKSRGIVTRAVYESAPPERRAVIGEGDPKKGAAAVEPAAVEGTEPATVAGGHEAVQPAVAASTRPAATPKPKRQAMVDMGDGKGPRPVAEVEAELNEAGPAVDDDLGTEVDL